MEKSAAAVWSLYISSPNRGEWYSWGEVNLGNWPIWLHRVTLFATVFFCQAGYAALASLVLTCIAATPPVQVKILPCPGLLRAHFHYAQGDTIVLMQLDLGIREGATARQ